MVEEYSIFLGLLKRVAPSTAIAGECEHLCTIIVAIMNSPFFSYRFGCHWLRDSDRTIEVTVCPLQVFFHPASTSCYCTRLAGCTASIETQRVCFHVPGTSSTAHQPVETTDSGSCDEPPLAHAEAVGVDTGMHVTGFTTKIRRRTR